MEKLINRRLAPKSSLVVALTLGALLFSYNSSACGCAGAIMGYSGQSGMGGVFSPFWATSGIPIIGNKFRMTSSGGWNGEMATGVTEYKWDAASNAYISHTTLTAPPTQPLEFQGFMSFYTSSSGSGGAYFTNTPRGNKLKQACEKSGGKWSSEWIHTENGQFKQHTGCDPKRETEKQRCEADGGRWTVYAYDPGVRQEACIPYVKPRLCQAGVGLASAAAGGSGICSTVPTALICSSVAIMAAAACEDGPVEDVFLRTL